MNLAIFCELTEVHDTVLNCTAAQDGYSKSTEYIKITLGYT